MAAPIDIATRIHAVQLARWFTSTLNNRFAIAMPVLEEYLKTKFKTDAEENFIKTEAAFFDYVDNSANTDLINFAKKHLQVKDRKSPSLPTLIERAITLLTPDGFIFDKTIPKRVNKRRGEMFHSVPLMNEGDVESFYEETQAITLILMLLTLRDLGVDIARLASERRMISEFSHFLSSPSLAP